MASAERKSNGVLGQLPGGVLGRTRDKAFLMQKKPSAFGCPTEAANSPHSPYSANW